MMNTSNSLWYCCRRLGIRTGFRYWRLYRRASKDSALFLVWADRWYEAAVHMEEAGFAIEAGILRDLAEEAVREYTEYNNALERQGGRTITTEGELGSDHIEENHTR